MENKKLSNFPLPLGMSDFTSLRQYQKIYVDKTESICQIASNPGFYFMSRPRRFGKSLLVSTLHSLFENGLKDFKGLIIENEWDEQAEINRNCQTLHLDFSSADLSNFSTPEQFRSSLNQKLEIFMDDHPVEQTPGMKKANDTIIKFDTWLERYAVCHSGKLVVLVDEYDAPLSRFLGDPRNFAKVRDILAAFYNTLKSHTGALRFMFITGICRFRHTSIFSGFNNLDDITMRKSYGTLLGYTEDELRFYFSPYIERAANALGLTYEQCISKMKTHYDGFCFDSHAATHVFSPWSVLKFLGNLDDGFANYWYESGGKPSVLMNYVTGHSLQDPMQYGKDHNISLDDLNSAKDLADLNDISLLTQTGYLSITSITAGGNLVVNYPNREVAVSMACLYADLDIPLGERDSFAKLFVSFDEENVTDFVTGLNSFIGQLSYEKYRFVDESEVQIMLYLCLRACGLNADIEVHNIHGRSDLEVKVKNKFFVFELKYAREGDNFDALLDKARSQLIDKHYGEYSYPELKHIRMALVFSGKERQFVNFDCF